MVNSSVLGFETLVFGHCSHLVCRVDMQPVRDHLCASVCASLFISYALMFPTGGGDCGETRGVWGESLQSDHKDAASKVPADLPPCMPWHSTNEE